MPRKKVIKKISRPTRYEVSGIFLKKLIQPEAIKKLEKICEALDVPAIVLMTREKGEPSPILLMHDSHENAKRGIMQVDYKNPEKAKKIIDILISCAGE